jgi:hypothetical protein
MGTTQINANEVDDKIWRIYSGNEIGRACSTNRGEDKCMWDIVGKSRKEESRISWEILLGKPWKRVKGKITMNLRKIRCEDGSS